MREKSRCFRQGIHKYKMRQLQQTTYKNQRRKNKDKNSHQGGLLMKWKEDDIVFCKVKKIEGTTVFLELEDNFPGTMVLSEVAAGRIRNLRQYVSPNKMVVCKILRLEKDHAELSLRRVTAKEREETLDNYKKERALRNMLKIIEENEEKIILKIKEEYSVSQFIEEAKTNQKIIEKFLSKENSKKLFEIISEKEGKEKRVEKRFSLKSLSEHGVTDIKEILNLQGAEIHYLGGSAFSISMKGKEFKQANSNLEKAIKEIEQKAKAKKALFEIKK